ncbi:MAG: GMC family oxidoreductase [Burkholderiaceae bacterium]
MANDPVDILIIGAGASGAAFAWRMADTRMRILCLEQGDWMNPAAYPSTTRDGELRQHTEFSFDPNVRAREEDYPVNGSDSPIQVANFNGVGGSTVLYAAHFPRLHPSDFRVKSCDGVADDWPIDYDTLAPYFAENDKMMGISGLSGDPAYPPGKEMPLPPVPLGQSGEAMARGFNKLGWHWWPSDSAVVTEPYEGRDRCLNLGPCTSGCAQGAKGSTDVTYWPDAIRRGVQLRTRCRVREITVDENDMATGVVYYDADGIEQFQPAEVVVLACNGIGTPRILLNSKSKRFPNGLANDSDMVGRNLMFHPYAWVMGAFEERLDGHYGPSGCCIWSKEFYETDLARGFVRGYTMEIVRGRGPLVTTMSGLKGGTIPWGVNFHNEASKWIAHSTGMVCICEDLPELHNRVTLDPKLTDSDGIPAPKINYTFSDNSLRMLDHAVARATEVLKAAGATDVHADSPWQVAGWHNLGTARMGDDPDYSVVNSWGRAHAVRNLFIVDGSIFVTSAGVNPTSTIQALSLYIADTMTKNLANLFD